MVHEKSVFAIANEISELQQSLKEKQVEQLRILIDENTLEDGLINACAVLACIDQVFSDLTVQKQGGE